MKILIASTIVPFIDGGGRLIVTSLAKVLAQHGHAVETVSIPFSSAPEVVLEQMLALRLFDLSESSDLLIAIRNPAHIIKHPNKILWFIHHYRLVYDLWGTLYQGIPGTAEGREFRNAIVHSDNFFLREARRIFTNSKVVSERLKKFNDINSEVLYPPLPDADRYYCGEFSNYVLYVSRITFIKRQYLAIRAMKYVKSDLRLVIAGYPDTPEQLELLHETVKEIGLRDRVQIIGRWISEDEKVDLYANALGTLYIPYDEDSYGYPTLESFQSKKPVITCTDSGGTLEIVEDGSNGFIVPAEAKELAAAMDRLREGPTRARRLGENGFEKLSTMGISWDKVVKSFTQ